MIDIIAFFNTLAVGVGLCLYGKNSAKDKDAIIAEPSMKRINAGTLFFASEPFVHVVELIR